MDLQFDKFNMITKQGDGGDTAANMGTYHFCLLNPCQLDRVSYLYAIQKLEYAPGKWRRHPDTTKWYAQPGMERMSRDQLTPLICAMATHQSTRPLLRLFLSHARHLWLFAFNTRKNHIYKDDPRYKWKLPDITGPEFFGYYIRAFNLKILYPLLLVSDLETLIGTIIKVIMFKLGKPDYDCRNSILTHLLALQIMPTPLTYLSRYIYNKISPIRLVTTWFNRPGEPEMHLIMIPIMYENGFK